MIRPLGRLIDFWAALSLMIALGGVVTAVFASLRSRAKRLCREKEILLRDSREALEENPAVARALAFLAGSGVDGKLDHFLDPAVSRFTEAEGVLKKDLDALFLVLNRIAQAVTVTGILRREETEVFSGYFRLIQHHPILSRYFYESGFLDLWDFAQSWMERPGVEEV